MPPWKPRELEILRLLSEGLTNQEIGARLHLAHDTVRWYNKRIFEKLDASNRTQAVARATELGLLEKQPSSIAPPSSPSVHYVANGDVHLAYSVIGNGPVDLLFIHGFLSHLEIAWETPEFGQFFESLSRVARVILFDKRGVGLSDRIQGAPDLSATISDACCILDAVGSKRAFIMGTSEGGASAVLLAATYPERVHGLILYASTPKILQTNHEPAWASTQAGFQNMIERVQQTWGQPWALESFAPSRAQDETFRNWWAKVLRAASSPSSIKAVLDLISDIDIRPLLPKIHIRTLVVHKTGDKMVNLEAGRYFATHIPNAEWVELPGADHIYFVECEGIIRAITQFIQYQEPNVRVDTWIATILYTILPPKSRQPDLTPYRPRHVLPTSHGIMASFDSPTRAVQCARHLTHTSSISLHIGECFVANGTPIPSVLEMSQRAARLASPGEIVLTRTLHDILAGSGFSFQARKSSDAFESQPLFNLI